MLMRVASPDPENVSVKERISLDDARRCSREPRALKRAVSSLDDVDEYVGRARPGRERHEGGRNLVARH